MIEWVFAFVIIFVPGIMPDGHVVPVSKHALEICQKEFPKGRVSKGETVKIIASGGPLKTEYVFICERPVVKDFDA